MHRFDTRYLTLPHCPFPRHITPVPPFLPFPFRPRTSPCKGQRHQPRFDGNHPPQSSPTKQDLTMPPIPIIAPQPRRLLPQPTIIDTSTPVLPINLDDPFIVSVSFSLAYLIRELISSLRSATHQPPRMLSFLASCPQSVSTIVPSALWSVFLSSASISLLSF